MVMSVVTLSGLASSRVISFSKNGTARPEMRPERLDDVVLDVERGTRRKLVLVLDLLLRKESPSPSMRLSATLGPYRRIESIMTPDRKLVRRW
ncbi:hypothetical protein PF005_g3864 [Phytophthora fragariae]|uniref:Uncharacterized protein n=1 Tax=Phytophthora fragariae TaxID=53985 RepID=A0A6A3FLU6_9STRA|nr:hypothetical protein PF009_g4242 [Phytophthora fragariae]KAE9132198.1 hypothetical protein PF007_g3809 [Phytophthora fragariae]KAE9229432.1 hypothetical protein PF005_g3864 [Phytophthora fragariae]